MPSWNCQPAPRETSSVAGADETTAASSHSAAPHPRAASRAGVRRAILLPLESAARMRAGPEEGILLVSLMVSALFKVPC